ncbi:hypothetical protein [Kordiimonas sp.]|uniref:hypothetical protein n=1 Tax=Kordiimonas sp. TaxID=1970157 RepID=UPI003A90DFF2
MKEKYIKKDALLACQLLGRKYEDSIDGFFALEKIRRALRVAITYSLSDEEAAESITTQMSAGSVAFAKLLPGAAAYWIQRGEIMCCIIGYLADNHAWCGLQFLPYHRWSDGFIDTEVLEPEKDKRSFLIALQDGYSRSPAVPEIGSRSSYGVCVSRHGIEVMEGLHKVTFTYRQDEPPGTATMELESDMTRNQSEELTAALNLIGDYCSRNLMDGWELKVRVSNSEMSCDLEDPDGDDVTDWESGDLNSVVDACDYSQEHDNG